MGEDCKKIGNNECRLVELDKARYSCMKSRTFHTWKCILEARVERYLLRRHQNAMLANKRACKVHVLASAFNSLLQSIYNGLKELIKIVV